MKKHIVRIVLGLTIVAAFLGNGIGLYRLPLVHRLEEIAYDSRLKATMPDTVDRRIVILDIDEKSLAEKDKGGEGRWPWPRNRLALLIDKLVDEYHVAVIGFDVVFAERDESSGIQVLERLGRGQLNHVPQYQAALQKLKPQLDYNAILARAMKGRPVVLGYSFSNDGSKVAPRKGDLPRPVLTRADLGGRSIGAISWSGYTANLPELQSYAASAGHFNPWTDDDGILRRVPMLVRYRDGYYEPLSLAVVRVLLGSPPVRLVYRGNSSSSGYRAVEALRVGPLKIPVGGHLAALVPYRGPQGSFRYISVVDVLHDRVPVGALKGKIVLVGTTAPGLEDLRATPVGPVYPGVEIHANLIAGMLDHAIEQKPSYVTGAEVTLLLLSGVILALILPVLTPLRATAVTLAALLSVVGVNLWIFEAGKLVLPLASGLAMIIVLFVFDMAYGFFVESRGRRQITGLFGQYVPPQLVEEMAKNPARFSMAGESREMTVLFSDVRGFTTISEGLDPKALAQVMNEFLTPLSEVIYRHRGTIDKYIGDCIMAFWGAPLSEPQHARHAVLAALKMQRRLRELEPVFRAREWPEIQIGIGINTGRMSVGNMGSRIRRAYTVMGDAVNLASRLEGVTKEYGADIIVGEATRNGAPEVIFREIDRVRVKGRDVAVTIYEPLGLQGEVDESRLAERELFHQALALYRSQEWDKAHALLSRLRAMFPGGRRYQTFVDRIAYLRAYPPGADWDGAFTFTTK